MITRIAFVAAIATVTLVGARPAAAQGFEKFIAELASAPTTAR